jgi:hypothetical protein
MVENVNQQDAMREAELDWEKDSVDGDYMSYVEFSKGMFELADMWVDSINARDYASFLRHMLNTISDTMNRGGFSSPVSWLANKDISVRQAGGVTSDMQAFLDKQRELDGQRRRKKVGEWDRPQMSHTEALEAVNKGMSVMDKEAMGEVMGMLSEQEQGEYVQAMVGMSRDERKRFTNMTQQMSAQDRNKMLTSMEGMNEIERGAFGRSLATMTEDGKAALLSSMSSMDEVDKSNFIASLQGMTEDEKLEVVKNVASMDANERRQLVESMAFMDPEGRKACVEAISGMPL